MREPTRHPRQPRSLAQLTRLAVACLIAVAVGAIPAAGTWLDTPVTSWNETAGRDGQLLARSAATFRVRCQLKDLRASAAQRAVSESGRVAFLPFDRNGGLIHDDI